MGFVRMLEPGVIIYDSADPSANRIKEAFSGTVSVRLIQVNAGSHNAMIMEEQYHPLNTTCDLVDLILACNWLTEKTVLAKHLTTKRF